MRLKQIKLAGFKSFVDPTSIDIPGQLVGVVGPNGCGKSNVMDAVRWVLGESKASELRGESMQDVIFNGSSDRKPASRSSVELVFDNSLGRIGGHWANYAEISVKRVLTRDGQSTYLVNNQQVRRRDVHDMFLGTGLGPRAYAIIGQGMISRLIEAKPEELRVYLEEAAGVSKYKERRRETENRLTDTRDNLTRVEDIVRELDGQIDKLTRQAEVAQRFREMESERDRKQRMLWLVRRDEAQAEQERIARQGAAVVNALDEALARQRACEAELERLRAEHYAVGDEVHGAQGHFYEANSEVSRLEAEIRFVVESQAQSRQRLQHLLDQAAQAQSQREQCLADGERGREQLAQLEALTEQLGSVLSDQSERLPSLESATQQAREALESAREQTLSVRQAIELSATRRHSAETQYNDLLQRRERLERESGEIGAPDPQAIEQMTLSLAAAEQAEQDSAQSQVQSDETLHRIEAQRAPAQQALREAEQKLAQIEARISALRQVQERVQSQGKLAPWLARHELNRFGRLWQRLKIEHGWETAIEAVLRESVSALQVERLDPLIGLISDAPPARVAFFAPQTGASIPADAPVQGARPLISLVRCGEAALQSMLNEWLHGVYAVDSIEAAAALRASLPPSALLVTPQGHLVERHSIRLYAPDAEQDGVLARQFELENLEREQRAQRLIADQTRDEAVRVDAAAKRAIVEQSEAREHHHRAMRHLASVRLDAERLEQSRQRADQSRERIERELSELDQTQQRLQAMIDEEVETFERSDVQLAEHQERVESLTDAHQQAEQQLAELRQLHRDNERQAQEKEFAIRELRSSLERLQVQAEQATRMIGQAEEERGQLESRLEQLSDAVAREQLQQALGRRAQAEEQLTAVRQRVDDLGHTLRTREEERLRIEREQEPMRQKQVDLQLKEQAARLNAEQYQQMLAEASIDDAAIEALKASFVDDAPRASWLQGEVTRIGNLIAELGPVNLAALDELEQSQERKTFLDRQSADLNEAITTLEDAIRRIDRETREVLQQTYDTVNTEFGRLFPELFGGGEARLVLTGDEILDAGIQVMAHPPGKRNASVHLLSGGEKALTAIALVFALFQLNPAPFCLLDEVDAPLDDANTERYCDMVRRMSDQTQFLFITHNKIAMELAQLLVGVTMQERGVSRIVAVDLDSAAQMAEAA